MNQKDLSWTDVDQDDLAKKANSVSLLEIFGYYGLSLDDYNDKMMCPFPFHKERTSSFYFYKSSNTFWCFGCKTGVRPVDFVSSHDSITKEEAIVKIVGMFGIESNVQYEIQPGQNIENLISFSRMVFDFKSIYNDDKSLEFINNICKSYDLLNTKHHLKNDALNAVNKIMKDRIDGYQKCLK